MQMNFELDLKKIEKDEKKKMLLSLVDYNMYYESYLICKLFTENTDDMKEKRVYNDIIKICKTTQNKCVILQMIKEL